MNSSFFWGVDSVRIFSFHNNTHTMHRHSVYVYCLISKKNSTSVGLYIQSLSSAIYEFIFRACVIWLLKIHTFIYKDTVGQQSAGEAGTTKLEHVPS